MPRQMYVKPWHLDSCAFELQEQGFTAPNRIILAAIINNEPTLVRCLNQYYGKPADGKVHGLDTYERGYLYDALVRFYLGDDRHWPCNGDSAEFTKAFVNDLTKAVTSAGWVIAD